MEESVKFAEESPFPDDNEVYKDVYASRIILLLWIKLIEYQLTNKPNKPIILINK